MITLSPDQQHVLDTLVEWFNKPDRPYITVGGYAGTGKSTLIAEFRKLVAKIKPKYTVAFCSYTGKATRVLQAKLDIINARESADTVTTIHSLLYAPLTNANEEIIGWEKKQEVKTDLIIVDEASMIDREIWNDLLSFRIPIIAVGDHGQLPPIRGSFNIMENPDLRLEKIHRQAQGNPIIALSIEAREKGVIAPGKFGPSIEKFLRNEEDARYRITELLESVNEQTLILCGFNATRVRINKYMRSIKEFFEDRPQSGDRVICVRNNHQKNIYNGMLGTVRSVEAEEDTDSLFMHITMDDGLEYRGTVYAPQFNSQSGTNFSSERKLIGDRDLFDFGYALTVHKAQGSQAKRVILFEERSQHMDDETWRKWLYTGITRAEEELYVIGRA